MIFRFCISGLSLIGIAAAAQAQTALDISALAKTVQKLSQRVDRLQKEVDQLRAASSGQAVPTVAPTTVVPAKKVPGQLVPVPGWGVDVIPADNETKDAVATFSWDKPTFNFGLHTKLIVSHDPFIYRGTAKFYPDQKARYVFQLILEPLRNRQSNFFRCMGDIRIGDEVIAKGKVATGYNVQGNYDRNGELFASGMFSGGAELEPPPDPSKGYVISFQVSCYLDDQDHAQLPDNAFRSWTDNRFSILVKGPDDAAGRPFASNELYHAGRVKAVR